MYFADKKWAEETGAAESSAQLFHQAFAFAASAVRKYKAK